VSRDGSALHVVTGKLVTVYGTGLSHRWLRRVFLRVVFLNRRAAARYRALASIIPGRERFSWNLSF